MCPCQCIRVRPCELKTKSFDYYFVDLTPRGFSSSPFLILAVALWNGGHFKATPSRLPHWPPALNGPMGDVLSQQPKNSAMAWTCWPTNRSSRVGYLVARCHRQSIDGPILLRNWLLIYFKYLPKRQQRQVGSWIAGEHPRFLIICASSRIRQRSFYRLRWVSFAVPCPCIYR